MWKLTIFIFIWRCCSAQYSVGVSSPFLLTSSMINIVTVEPDLQDQYLVSFIDGQARRYSADFSSFTDLSVPQTVQQFIPLVFQVNNIQLTNGTIFTMLSNMTATLSNNFTTLRAYTYPAFTLLQSFTFTEPVIDYQGLPLFTSQLEPFHILVFNQTTKVIYKGATTTAFDTNQSLGSYNVAVVFKQYVLNYGGDQLNFTFMYIHKMGSLGLIQVNITVNFKYNYTSSTYDLSVSSNLLTTSPMPMNVKTMLITNGIVLMQMHSTFTLRLYSRTVNYNDYFDPNILQNDILEFFYIFNTYYILYTRGLIKATIDEVNGIFLYTTLVNTLPINPYQLTFGVNLDTLFIPGTPYLYKAKCLNQTAYSAGTCTNYNCSVVNCDICPLTANTCQACSAGFTRTDSFTCIDPAVNTANTTGTIPPSNTTTNPTTSNTSTFIQPINSTTTSSNGSANTTLVVYRSSRFYSIFPFLQRFKWLQSLFFGVLNTTKDLISVPSLRRVSPTFYFFGNFDDLYLYSFHDRLYGSVMTSLFGELSDIEDKKWSLFDYGAVLKLFGLSNSSFFGQIDYQHEYLTYRFKTADRPEQGSEALLVNCANFFLTAMPLTVVIFLLLRFIFRLLFNYPVSQLLRKFDLVGCLLAGLFDGNIQQFAFYSTAELSNIFFFSLGDKWMKLFSISFGFLLVLISVGGLLISFGMYRKLNKYLVDNNRNNLAGVCFLLLQYGLRNFVFGVLHSLLRPLPYAAMIMVLLSAELLFTMVFILSFTLRIYKRASFMWFYIIISLIRILLIATLAIDNNMVNDDTMEGLQCTLILFMVLTYFLGTFTIILMFFVDSIKDIAKIAKPNSNNKPSSRPNHCQPIPNTTTINTNVIKQGRTGTQGQKRKITKKTVFSIKNTILRIVEIEGGIKQYRKTRPVLTHQ